MKLLAPKYYGSFRCIADKCKHSCCIGWEIDVDEQTLELYGSMSARLIDSIDMDEVPHFRLSAGDRCPHLLPNGLCSIISTLGEGYIPEICREHPRFYSDTARARIVGIGMSCEEAARLILSSDDYSLSPISELRGEPRADFDVQPDIDRIYSVLSRRDVRYDDRLAEIRDIFGVGTDVHTKDEWEDIFSSLELLDREHSEWLSLSSAPVETPEPLWQMLERSLAYFVLRHCSGAASPEDFRSSLGLALLLERILASAAVGCGDYSVDSVAEFARVLSCELEYSEENTDELRFEFY